MSERTAVWILTPDHMIDGFDLEIDRQSGQVKLRRGETVLDITHKKANKVDYVILAPYRVGMPPPKKNYANG